MQCKEQRQAHRADRLGSALDKWYRHFLAEEIGKYVTEEVRNEGDALADDVCMIKIADVCSKFI